MKWLLFLAVSALFEVGCVATAPSTSNTKIPAKFDFTPPSRTQPGAAALTIALVKPKFIGENPEYYVAPFNEMASNMANDFEELLSAKGFRIRGPYGSRDEMVYNDKQNTNFALEVQIDLRPEYNRKYKYDAGLGAIIAASYRMTGEVTLGGNLVLTAASPQYGEKIWKKNISLDKATFSYTGTVKWATLPSMADELRQDNTVYNAISRELEKYYMQAMELAWRQIEVSEMTVVSNEAKKADKKG